MNLPRVLLAALLALPATACTAPHRRAPAVDLGSTDLGPIGMDMPAFTDDAGRDAGPPDLGFDAGPPDLGFDAGRPDLGVDAGRPDLGVDAGRPDLGIDGGPAGTGRLLLSEIATGRGTVPDDEFVELYNPSASAYDASGLLVEYRGASSTAVYSTMATLPAGTTIAGHGYYLLTHALIYTAGPVGDLTFTTSLGGAGGHIRLTSATGAELDRCGWGTAPAPEGTPTAGGLTGTQTRERKALATSTAATMAVGGADELRGNSSDTNDNGADFVVRELAEPQNSASVEVP